jgi:hypothetical protein
MKMKRELFGMLFLIAFIAVYFLVVTFLGKEDTTLYLSRYIVIWLLMAFYVGQYSMRFPKGF